MEGISNTSWGANTDTEGDSSITQNMTIKSGRISAKLKRYL